MADEEEAMAKTKHAWFDGVTNFIPACASSQQSKESIEHGNDAIFFNEPSQVSQTEDLWDHPPTRGFFNTDIVMIEAKHIATNTVRFGRGVLMKDFSTWRTQETKSWIAMGFWKSDPSKSIQNSRRSYRFVITAAHVVCSAQWGIEIYDVIRVRIPLKPWPAFPENWEKYRGGYEERKDFFSNIIVKQEHIFVHPNYDGTWHDIAMIAIPEVTATENAKGFAWWNSQRPTSFAVVGFPMACSE